MQHAARERRSLPRPYCAQLAELTGKDVPLPAQLPFILMPDDRGLLFRSGDAGFGIDFAAPRVRRIADGGIDAQLLDGAIVSPTGDRAVVQQGDGFAVTDGAVRTLIARTGTPDLAWQLPESLGRPMAGLQYRVSTSAASI